MKAHDLRDRTVEDLGELKKSLQKDLFFYRMKNAVGQLEDTSLIRKTRRDIARIEGVLVTASQPAAARTQGGTS